MSKRQPQVVVFLTTFDSHAAAKRFCKTLLQDKLAACMNLIPQIESFYFWDNKMQQSKEVLVLGKTTPQAFKKIKSKIKILHSYKMPELISISVNDGSLDYLQWVKASVGGK